MPELEGKEGWVRMETKVPEDLRIRAKLTAALQGKTVEAWLRDLVERHALPLPEQSS